MSSAFKELKKLAGSGNARHVNIDLVQCDNLYD